MKLFNYEELKFFAVNGFNVLFEGGAGVGKTACVSKLFTELFGKNWKYFSCSTLDPYIDIRGIPREQYRTDAQKLEDVLAGRTGKMEFMAPDWHEYVEAIFLDEVGRDDKPTRNALMELTQFKSINGVKLPNLKIVWGAKNPVDENGTYSVEQLDPAQLSRFHAVIKVPYDLEDDYFTEKYGPDVSTGVCSWWRELPDQIRKDLNPRQLDSAMQIYMKGGNIRYSVHEASNVDKLLQYLHGGPCFFKLQEIIKSKLNKEEKNSAIKNFLNVENNYASCIKHILAEPKFLQVCLPNMKHEKIADLVATNDKAFDLFEKKLDPDFKDVFIEIFTSHINKQFNEKIKSKIAENRKGHLAKAVSAFGGEVIHNALFFSSPKPATLPPSFKFTGNGKHKELMDYVVSQETEFFKIANDASKSAETKAVYDKILSHVPDYSKWDTDMVKSTMYGLSLIFGIQEKWDSLQEKSFPNMPAIVNQCFKFLRQNNLWDKAMADPDEWGMSLFSNLQYEGVTEFSKQISLNP